MTTLSIFKLALMVFAISATTILIIGSIISRKVIATTKDILSNSLKPALNYSKQQQNNDDISKDIIDFLNGIANDISVPYESFILDDEQLQRELNSMRISDYKKLNERLNFAIKNEDYLTAKSIQDEINKITQIKPSANGNA